MKRNVSTLALFESKLSQYTFWYFLQINMTNREETGRVKNTLRVIANFKFEKTFKTKNKLREVNNETVSAFDSH